MDRWEIRGVDKETIRKVKIYAAVHDLTLAQALTALVDIALEK